MKFILSLLSLVFSEIIYLAKFDNDPNYNHQWVETNDPVMGGASTGGFQITNNLGVFSGDCKIVPSLNAPGFCKVTTKKGLTSPSFPDISNYLDKGISLRVRTNTSQYGGFRIAFSAKGVPRTSIFGGGSFKSGFSDLLKNSSDWQVVTVPFNRFSYDWSAYTGRCDTTDPNGQQHHCCENGNKYCPQKKYLSQLTGLELWAEGSVGLFYLEVDWIGIDPTYFNILL